jgi:hypothetical protein
MARGRICRRWRTMPWGEFGADCLDEEIKRCSIQPNLRSNRHAGRRTRSSTYAHRRPTGAYPRGQGPLTTGAHVQADGFPGPAVLIAFGSLFFRSIMRICRPSSVSGHGQKLPIGGSNAFWTMRATVATFRAVNILAASSDMPSSADCLRRPFSKRTAHCGCSSRTQFGSSRTWNVPKLRVYGYVRRLVMQSCTEEGEL